MLDALGPDPWPKIGLGAIIIVVAAALWSNLMVRIRANGGGILAGLVVAAGLAGLLAAIAPGLLSTEVGLIVLIAALVVLYRPDLVVRWTGGPSVQWRALRDGRAIAHVVRGGQSDANPINVRERLEAMDPLVGPSTSAYLAALRTAVDQTERDPDSPDATSAWLRVAELDAELRARLTVRPIWEPRAERAPDQGRPDH